MSVGPRTWDNAMDGWYDGRPRRGQPDPLTRPGDGRVSRPAQQLAQGLGGPAQGQADRLDEIGDGLGAP